MDLRKIKKLIDLLEESNLAELEIKEGEEVVRLSRVPKGTVTTAPMMQAAPVARRARSPLPRHRWKPPRPKPRCPPVTW